MSAVNTDKAITLSKGVFLFVSQGDASSTLDQTYPRDWYESNLEERLEGLHVLKEQMPHEAMLKAMLGPDPIGRLEESIEFVTGLAEEFDEVRIVSTPTGGSIFRMHPDHAETLEDMGIQLDGRGIDVQPG